MFFFSGHDGKGYTGCPACGDSPSGPACEPAIASFVTEGLMERWTRGVLRFRWPILTGWLVVLLAGFVGFTHLCSLLSNVVLVPGTDSVLARLIFVLHFGVLSDCLF